MPMTVPMAVPTSFEACTETVIAASLSQNKELQSRFSREFFQSVLGLNLSLEQSLEAWQQICRRHGQLAGQGGPNVSFRVALVEYFLHSPLVRDPIITEFEELQRLRFTSTTDSLTGTHNRRLFDTFLAKEVHRAARYGDDLSLILFDLNRFKQVNDTHGHATGDELLKLTGKLMVECLRSSDFAYRIGGDEFALLLPRASQPNATLLAERLRKRFDDAIKPRNLGVAVSLAFGVATSPREARQPQALFDLADQRLYDFKRSVGSPRCAPRRFERIPMSAVNAYLMLRDNGDSCRGSLIDFSIGGVGLRIPNEIQIADCFSGDLYLQFLPPVPTSLRKVCLGPEEPAGRRLGCEFIGPMPGAWPRTD